MYLFSHFYFYFFTQNGFDQKSSLEGDSEKGSRFGSSIANIGDINNDGFNGEPYIYTPRLKKSLFILTTLDSP